VEGDQASTPTGPTVERGFGRLKHWCGIVSRYGEYALSDLATIVLNNCIRE